MRQNIEYPETPETEEIDERTKENIQFLAEKVGTPFPLADLLKIGQMITKLQRRAETAEAQSMTDQLTGLPNRRYFDEQLAATISEAERRGLTFYLAMIDYDDFKSINTAYGWTGGDSALILISSLNHREGEPISRYGGDEFAQIITPDSERELVEAAQRYHSEIVEKGAEVFRNITTMKGQSPIPVRISIGFARWQGETAEELTKKASAAALEAKSLGKGTAVLARTLSDGQTRFLEIGKHQPPQQASRTG